MSNTKHTVKVWDISVRLFHWALVLCIGFLWYSGETGGNIMQWHMYIGYAVLALVIYRLLWGFAGGRYARFKDFIYSPKNTLLYLKESLQRREPHYLSHNPLGGWMVVTLLLLVGIQAVSGLFTTDDIFTEGPLFTVVDEKIGYFLTSTHKFTFNLLLACIALHVLAVLYHQIFKREPLVKSMLTGKKTSAQPTANTRPNYLAMLISAFIAGGLVALAVMTPSWL